MEKIKIMLKSYLEASKIIKNLKLTWGYFIGGFVGIIILIFFYWISSYIGEWIFEKLNLIFGIQKYTGLFKWTIIFIIRVIMISVQYFFFKTILLGILAPFFSYVSEKVEKYEENISYSFTFKENMKFIIRGFKIASKSFFKEMCYTIIAIILGFIPIINIFVPLLIFIIQSYFISYNFVDYTLERKRFSAEESLEFMKENRVTFILGGAIFTIIYFIPLVGIVVAPIISIVAFTITTLKILKLKNVNKEQKNTI